MMHLTTVLIAAALVPLGAAQQSGWITGNPFQVNTTLCQWQSSRAAVIRDTLFIDGGLLEWLPGMSDGTYGGAISDDNPLGLVFTINFSMPFNTSQNSTTIFGTISKGTSTGAVYNLAPNYYAGSMFANDYEFMLYGGLPELSNIEDPQASNAVAAFDLYSVPVPGKKFIEGFNSETLTSGITRYVSNAASVSVPSENLGFSFAGGRSASGGPIYYLPGPANESVNADTLSSTLIEVDLSDQFLETWVNHTLPASVPGRIDPEIVWVPVSKQGVLVAIGGVINAPYLNVNSTLDAQQIALSTSTSPGFMTTVSVYDIANSVWYEQPTSGSAPGQLAQGCTVLASAQDGSSHNIYWYGGFNGLDQTSTFNDNVYVLSIPSFTWTQVSLGTATHGRAGHKCAKPYPDQMIVTGGYPSLAGTGTPCLDGFVQIYNLSSNTWMTSYNPSVWSNYSVPSAVYAVIGGTVTGGATMASPTAGFANSSMTALFGASYNTTKITTWYPYTPASATATPSRSILPSATVIPSGKSSTPSYLAPVLGVVLGLFFVTLLVLAFMLWRRRNYLRASIAAQSESETIDNRRWIDRWIIGTQADIKAPTVTTDELTNPISPYVEERPQIPELGQGNERFELDATSKPLELHNQTMQDTGLIPLGFLNSNGRVKSPGIAHSNSVTSHASSVSHLSDPIPSPRPNISPSSSPHADIPSNQDPRIVSGVSNISEAERSHMRGISETSVSTIGAYGTPSEEGGGLGLHDRGDGSETGFHSTPPVVGRPTAVSPVTPPSATGGFGVTDYLSARASGEEQSPGRRRSNFSEGLDENLRK